ncbi:MAG: hypothetical protein IT437_09655 [Phycisphaerales bacterium]|nr:hypothetical protein [Phycisphaerales bacterium]
MTFTRFRIARALLCLMVAALIRPALGQQRDLPENVVRGASPGPAELDQLDRYVNEYVPLISSQDPREITRGRTALLRPLEDRQIGVRFRDEYSSRLVPKFEALLAGPNEINGINALVVAGALATKPATDLIEKYSTDTRVAVRYAAEAALGKTFQAISETSPAIVGMDAVQLVRRLAARLETEDNAWVFDAAVRSLIKAGQITRNGYEAASAEALSGLAAGAGGKLRKLAGGKDDDAFAAAVIRAAGTLRDAAGNNARPFSTEQAKAAAALGGELWAWVFRGVSGSPNPPIPVDASTAEVERIKERRRLSAEAVSAAQGVIAIALGRLQPGIANPFQDDLSNLVSEATAEADARFLQRTREVFGPAGVMGRPPLSFQAGRFLR